MTIVPFFDSLGPSSLSFILNQTSLETLCIEGSSISALSKLKASGEAPTLKHLVLLDPVSKELEEEAKKAGLEVCSY